MQNKNAYHAHPVSTHLSSLPISTHLYIQESEEQRQESRRITIFFLWKHSEEIAQAPPPRLDMYNVLQ